MKKLAIAVFILTIVISCFEEETIDRDYPKVKTLEVTLNESGEISFIGKLEYNNIDVIDHGFQISEFENFSVLADDISLGRPTAPGEFSAKTTLPRKKDTFYYVRVFAKTKEYRVIDRGLQFLSLIDFFPVINSVSPSEGVWGDTVSSPENWAT